MAYTEAFKRKLNWYLFDQENSPWIFFKSPLFNGICSWKKTWSFNINIHEIINSVNKLYWLTLPALSVMRHQFYTYYFLHCTDVAWFRGPTLLEDDAEGNIEIQRHRDRHILRYVKFIYSEKATKFCKIFTLLLTVCSVVKSKVKISQNFLAFSEYMNFIRFRKIC